VLCCGSPIGYVVMMCFIMHLDDFALTYSVLYLPGDSIAAKINEV